MKVYKAPEKWKKNKPNQKTIFLAGSIEQGKADNWQEKITKFLSKTKYADDIIVLNPRRDNWDSSLEQSIENKTFKEQVDWELSSQETADMIIMFFDENTKSPISLLETGLFGRTGKMVVYCPDKFYRKGNVDIVCERYNISCTNDFEDFLKLIYQKLKQVIKIKNKGTYL